MCISFKLAPTPLTLKAQQNNLQPWQYKAIWSQGCGLKG